MASTGNSPTNSDWIELPPSSDRVYRSNSQATSTYSGGAEAENQGYSSSSWSLWDLIQKPLSWVTTGDASSVDRKDDSVDYVAGASNMAASAPPEQKKGASGFIKKAGGAMKKIFRSDEQWELLEYNKELKGEKPAEKEEDVFSIILHDKMELQTKNTQLLKKIAELERKVKEGESQIAKKERELQHLQRLGQRDKPHALQRQSSYEKAITSSQVSESNKDQEIRLLKRQLDTLRWEGERRVFEVSKNDEEIRQLKEHIELLQNQKLAAETDVANASKQAKYFEIRYCTEREHSQRLRDEIKQLQQQLDVSPLPKLDDKSSGGEESRAKVIAQLQNRIKLLNDNVSKLQEHSVEQSRTILNLKQQAEMSQYMEEQVQSMEGLLEEAERERDYLHKLLLERKFNAHKEENRGTGQDGSPSLTDIQAQLTDMECQLCTLTKENKELNEKLIQAEVQVLVYKADFEAERRDRERIHGLVYDLKKEKTHVEGYVAHERAAYKQTLDDIQQDLQFTKEHLHKHKTLLADAEKLNQIRVQEAQKAKDEIDAVRGEAEKYFQEAEKFRESALFWRSQAEANQRDIQAKASQVKQYAKEVERLKEKDDHKKQKAASKQNVKVLMDMYDKVTKERDHLKEQNEQLTKQIDQLKKKRKGSTDKLLASPYPPPEEDSTSIEIGYAFQQADVATAKATEAERRAKEAEKQARTAGLKQRGAESHAVTMEKQLDEKMVEVQSMAAENEKLHDEIYQMKRANKQPGAVVATSHDELHEDLLAKVDPKKHQKKRPPLYLRSCDHESPPATQNRSYSPLPVAIVKPTFQRQKPQPPYRQYTSVGPAMVEAHPLAQPVSPPLPHAHYYNQQQQINVMENVKIDNPQSMKQDVKDVEELDDRPFDPNLICPMCKQQFRIGEIGYSRHYKICQKQSEEEIFQLDLLGQNMAGDTQPFTPIQYPSMDVQSVSQMGEVMPEPKLLCRTPGCSFKGYEDLGGLCPDCSSQGNIQEDQ